MRKTELERIIGLQKQFIIFVADEVCTIAQAEARGLIDVQIDERTGEVAYQERPRDSEYRGLFEPTH